MTGFEAGSFYDGSDRSSNCANTNAHNFPVLFKARLYNIFRTVVVVYLVVNVLASSRLNLQFFL